MSSKNLLEEPVVVVVELTETRWAGEKGGGGTAAGAEHEEAEKSTEEERVIFVDAGRTDDPSRSLSNKHNKAHTKKDEDK